MSKKQALLFSVAVLVLVGLAVVFWWMFSKGQVLGDVASEIVEEVVVDQAELRVFSSNVEVLIPGEADWREGIDGVKIVAGTRVRTNQTGRAEIRFPGGSVTRIDRNSEILIEILDVDEASFLINLTKGKIWSRVSKLLGKVTYETKTGRTVATVRGTEYGHETYDGFDRVVVAESKVDVKCVGENPNTLVVDVQISDWSCGEGGKPEVEESSIDELMMDEWYKFNLQNESEVGDAPEPIKVLGVTDESAYVPTPRPAVNNQIDCVGPDGKTARSTKEECDRLWNYWNDNPPPAAPKTEGPSNQVTTTTTAPAATPTPSASPSPTPVPINVTSATCLNDGCFKIAVTGSGFGPGIRLIAKDSAIPPVATEGVVNVLDANNIEVDYGTAYSLCYSSTQLPPSYDLLVFYVVGNEFVYPAFAPDFCSIIL